MTTTAIYNNVKTNIAWMPELPEHWKLCRGKNLFIEKSIKNFPNEPLLAASQKQGVVLKTMLDQKSMEAIENFETFKLVDVNDFVISLRSFEGGIEIAYYRGIISPVYNIFNFRNSEEYCYDFFKYLFKSRMFIQELNIYKKGIRDGQSINYTEFANIIFPIPPYIEQKKIANYLDTQSQKINHFIAKKQQFIALLKEQRQSIVTNAVTKGINRKAKLKSTNIEWIGDVPQHWEVRRLKFTSDLIYGISPNEKTYNDKGIGSILINGPVEYSEEDFGITRELKWTTEPQKFAPKGALLFCLRGSTTGRLNICHTDVSIGRGVAAIIGKLITQEFLVEVMSILRKNIENSFKGSTFPSVTSQDLNNYYITVPPLPEQDQIVNHIKTETSTIDTAIVKTEREIELIKEYKEAMIAEAVMGKVNFNKKANK